MVQTIDADTIQRRIVELQVEHRDLDQIIDMLTAQPGFDQLQIRRLKKRKLQIKDAITLLQIQLEPDIPA
ncbi:YdcH family protein [Limnobacter humi]|uniref:YdcH family protein n=1 Tax=Limnobacter humi TaxID=1778671 RepID=A0ABT1WFF1_9BURK|nr:YdcH family protein [Limnobacter humi]MCQ8896236.1 YdcH family protein [Limnobacter humi]